MAQISFSDLVNGVIPDASDFNTRFNALKDRFNNGIEGDNIAAASISTAKIVNDAVTADKIDEDDDFAWTGAHDFTGATVTGVTDVKTFASVVEVKAGTEAAKAVAPSTMIGHEGVIKGWISFNGTGTPAINDSYNVSGIVDNGTGDYTISWDVDFATANYSVVGNCSGQGRSVCFHGTTPLAVGSTRILTVVSYTGNPEDRDIICAQAIGDR